MSRNILSINNLSKAYYSKDREMLAIEDISLDIKENSITAIVGPSGCGKSTKLQLIAGLINPDSGDRKVVFCRK